MKTTTIFQSYRMAFMTLSAASFIFFFTLDLSAQSALSQLEDAAGQKVNVTPVSSPSMEISTMIAGALIQSLFSSSSDAEAQKQAELQYQQQLAAIQAAKEQAKKDSIALANYKHLMEATKPLSPGTPDLDFQNLDGEAEQLSARATAQFMPQGEPVNRIVVEGGTPFFGSVMSDEMIMDLIAPETNPVYLDVKEAHSYMVASLKEQDATQEPGEAEGEPVIEKPDCVTIRKKLDHYKTSREKFMTWNYATVLELEKWQKQNDQAFWNAVMDAADFAVGELFTYAKERSREAQKLKTFLITNEQELLNHGLSPEYVAKMKSLIEGRISQCNQILSLPTGNIAASTVSIQSYVTDYYEVVRNSLHALSAYMLDSDDDYKAFCQYLQREGLLSDFPLVDAGQFFASKGIQCFLEKKGLTKLPYVSIASLATKQIYNAVDWWLSYQNVITLTEADGKAKDTAVKIDNTIRELEMDLENCQ